MWDIIDRLYKALGIEETWKFVLLVGIGCALVFGLAGGAAAWVIGKGYKNSPEYKAEHPDPKSKAAPDVQADSRHPEPVAALVTPKKPKTANPVPPCDTNAVINNCNSPRTTIDRANIHATAPALNNEHSPDTHIGTLEYNVPSGPSESPQSLSVPQKTVELTKQLADCSKNPTALEVCNVGNTKMTDNTTFGCGPAVKTENAPNTTINGIQAHAMPAGACVFYYGALRLQPACYQRNGTQGDELKQMLVQWETGVSHFWTGDNLKKWKQQFGNDDPTVMSLDILCADIDTNSPKMTFFRIAYYGTDPYQATPLPH